MDRKKERKVVQTMRKREYNWRRQAFSDRRSKRMAELGRITEERVARLLTKKREAEQLVSFERHLPNTPEDREGKDFTVRIPMEGKVVTVSFGITCSAKLHQWHLLKHPQTPSIHIPPEMRDERIWERIVMLASERLEP